MASQKIGSGRDRLGPAGRIAGRAVTLHAGRFDHRHPEQRDRQRPQRRIAQPAVIAESDDPETDITTLTAEPGVVITRAFRSRAEDRYAMSRRCEITGKGVLSGNNVSHANNKTRRRFLPNLQVTSLLSDILGHEVRMRLSTRGIRTVEHNGGIDAFLLDHPEHQADRGRPPPEAPHREGEGAARSRGSVTTRHRRRRCGGPGSSRLPGSWSANRVFRPRRGLVFKHRTALPSAGVRHEPLGRESLSISHT